MSSFYFAIQIFQIVIYRTFTVVVFFEIISTTSKK